MAVVTTYQRPQRLIYDLPDSIMDKNHTFTLPAGGALNTDNIVVFTTLRASRLTLAILSTSGTLGAGCTLRLQKNTGGTRTDIIPTPTTAGVASAVRNSGATIDLAIGDVIECLVGGANVSVAATVNVDLLVQRY